MIKNSWPERKEQTNNIYIGRINELAVIVYRGNAIVKTLRLEIIDRLHYNHMGMEKTILCST